MRTERREGEPQPREGIKFRLELNSREMLVYIEEQEEPVYRHQHSFADIGDEAFQAFIRADRYSNFRTIKNRTHRTILKGYASQKALGRTGDDLTFRFLRVKESDRTPMAGNQKIPTNILTSDKQDITERKKGESRAEAARQAYQELYRKALAGETITEAKPLTAAEKQYVEQLKQARFLHYFGRGSNRPPLAMFDINPFVYLGPVYAAEVIETDKVTGLQEKVRKFQHLTMTEEEINLLEKAKYAPRRGTAYNGDEFLALLVRAGLTTSEQIKGIFENPPENFNVINWQKLRWEDWPRIRENGEGLAILAKLLNKEGVQRYAWDGGYGDISESWRTVFINPEGHLFWEGTQTYGAMHA